MTLTMTENKNNSEDNNKNITDYCRYMPSPVRPYPRVVPNQDSEIPHTG